MFSYAAGMWLSNRLNLNLEIDTSLLQTTNQRPGSSILAFNISAQVRSFDAPLKARLTVASQIAVLNQTFREKLVSRLTPLIGAYVSPEVGYDSQLESLTQGVALRGYFQSFRYFEEVKGRLTNEDFKLHSTTSWFSDQLERMEIDQPLTIHIRRGDYLLTKNSRIGTLAPDYFKSALDLVVSMKNSELENIWVFSDEIASIKEEFGFLRKFNCRFIDPPKESSAAENLVLMSKGSSHVMSNSTFSFWAGALSQSPLVVAPKKWFKGMEDPNNLYPPGWELIESKWL